MAPRISEAALVLFFILILLCYRAEGKLATYLAAIVEATSNMIDS